MNKKSIITMMLALVTMAGCVDKSSAEFEVSLEGQLVRTDVNKGKWPKWMFGDEICSWDRDRNLYLSKLTRTEWQKAEKILVHGHGQNEFGDMVLSQDNDGVLYVLDHPLEGDMGSLALTSLTKIQKTDNIATMKDPNNWEKYDLSEMPFLLCGDRFEVLSDSTLLTVGTSKDDIRHIFSVINFKNQAFTPLDYWPNDSTPEVLDHEKLMVYTHGSGIKGNGKDRFLYWDDSGKLAFIFTIDGTKKSLGLLKRHQPNEYIVAQIMTEFICFISIPTARAKSWRNTIERNPSRGVIPSRCITGMASSNTSFILISLDKRLCYPRMVRPFTFILVLSMTKLSLIFTHTI